jgi:hypothetical protein
VRTLAGLFFATLLTMTAGCARTDWIDRTLVTVDVTGAWEGSVGGMGGTGSPPGNLLFELEQQGSIVKGSLRLRALAATRDVSGPIEGTVAGDLFRFRNARGSMEGELTISGDEMKGMMSFTGHRPISHRRVDPTSLPASPPR